MQSSRPRVQGVKGDEKVTMTEFLLATVIARSSREIMSSVSGNFLFCFSNFLFFIFFSFARSPLLPVLSSGQCSRCVNLLVSCGISGWRGAEPKPRLHRRSARRARKGEVMTCPTPSPSYSGGKSDHESTGLIERIERVSLLALFPRFCLAVLVPQTCHHARIRHLTSCWVRGA